MDFRLITIHDRISLEYFKFHSNGKTSPLLGVWASRVTTVFIFIQPRLIHWSEATGDLFTRLSWHYSTRLVGVFIDSFTSFRCLRCWSSYRVFRCAIDDRCHLLFLSSSHVAFWMLRRIDSTFRCWFVSINVSIGFSRSDTFFYWKKDSLFKTRLIVIFLRPQATWGVFFSSGRLYWPDLNTELEINGLDLYGTYRYLGWWRYGDVTTGHGRRGSGTGWPNRKAEIDSKSKLCVTISFRNETKANPVDPHVQSPRIKLIESAECVRREERPTAAIGPSRLACRITSIDWRRLFLHSASLP